MFTQMPQPLREQVLKFLEKDDFTAAKEVYDSWHNHLNLDEDEDDEGVTSNIFLPMH